MVQGSNGLSYLSVIISFLNRTFRRGINLMVPIHCGPRQGNCRPVCPANLSAVHAAGFAEPEVYRIGVLRTVRISGHKLPNRGVAVVMNRHLRADR